MDQFIRKLPFHKMDKWTDKLVWNRSDNFSDLVTAAEAKAIDESRSAQQLSVPSLAQERSFVRFGDFLEVDVKQDPALYRELVKAKKAAVVRDLGDKVLNGDTQASPPYDTIFRGFLDGYNIKTTQTRTATSGTFDLDDLDLIGSLVTASDDLTGAGPDCFVCCALVWRYILKLIRTAGFRPHFVFDEDLGVPVLHYNGIPVYIGQNRTDEGTSPDYTNSLWAVKLRGPTGVKLCHLGGDPQEFGTSVEDLDRYSSTYTYHAKFVGGSYALLVPEEESIARLSEISSDAATLGGLPT